MTQIFISYRRQDSAAWSGRLFDTLTSRYGVDNVFLDIATLSSGRRFAEQVEAALANSDVVLIVIGPQWLEATYRSNGRRRIDDPEDLVRREIQSALSIGKRIVPVLVGYAEMPSANSLPTEIEGLTHLNACRLSDSSWNEDIERLTGTLDQQAPSLLQRLFGRRS